MAVDRKTSLRGAGDVLWGREKSGVPKVGRGAVTLSQPVTKNNTE